MPDHHDGHNEQDPQNHDDCQDCKRQRAQNQQFIAIYQKLQQVDKRTSDIKGSISLHQQQVEKNKQVIKAMEQKVEQAKLLKNEQDLSQFEHFGYYLYAETIANAKKSEALRQNQRLKAMLKKIYEENNHSTKILEPIAAEKSKPPIDTLYGLPPLLNKESIQWFEKGNQSSRTDSRTNKSFQQTSIDKSFEIFSTKSSFNMTKRKTFEKKDFEQLNLWLFEQRNQILEKDLYESRPKQLNHSVGDKHINVGNKHTSFNKGVQRYINMAKNATRLGNSTVLRSSVKRQTSLIKRGMTDSLNLSTRVDNPMKNNSKIQTVKTVQPQNLPNSGRVSNRRAYKGSVLPAISSK